ncbi:MAG: hypothetical protein U0U69_13705 [Acidimicrobiia bacterium]
MSDSVRDEGPDDPGDAAVPDYEGEVEYVHDDAAADSDTGAAVSGAGPVGARAIAILVAIVLVIGAAILWVVLTRGPA